MFHLLFINITIFYIQHITHEKSVPKCIIFTAMLNNVIRSTDVLCLSRGSEDYVSNLLFDYYYCIHFYINRSEIFSTVSS